MGCGVFHSDGCVVVRHSLDSHLGVCHVDYDDGLVVFLKLAFVQAGDVALAQRRLHGEGGVDDGEVIASDREEENDAADGHSCQLLIESISGMGMNPNLNAKFETPSWMGLRLH